MEKLLGCYPITPTPDENVKDVVVLLDRPPDVCENLHPIDWEMFVTLVAK
jgi:hypothetical protein